MCDFLITLAATDAVVVTPIVDRVLISVNAGIEHSSMDTAVTAAVTASWVVAGIDGVTILSL